MLLQKRVMLTKLNGYSCIISSDILLEMYGYQVSLTPSLKCLCPTPAH